ncbi:hypothetical protein NL676_001802 [Syzygium grande]|nr:hypothetical protein NL676_001802 [Syzygium grande]
MDPRVVTSIAVSHTASAQRERWRGAIKSRAGEGPMSPHGGGTMTMALASNGQWRHGDWFERSSLSAFTFSLLFPQPWCYGEEDHR